VLDMLKTLLLVLAGLGAGLAIAFWLQPSSAPSSAASATAVNAPVGAVAADDRASATRLAALEEAFAAEVEQRALLETRVARLAAQLDARGERPVVTGADAAADGSDQAAIEQPRARVRGTAGASRAETERRTVEQLVAAGFAPDRAEWINRRTQELRMQALQAQYDATREGRAADFADSERTLRTELGDAEYERYLTALDRPTSVPVRDVLASSPAERSGLQPGDEVVAYGGQRVFDMRDLNALTLEGTPGESVVVEVRRDGQNVQLVMPRGPIGILGGGIRRR
jgi:hypothetical protein